MGVIAMLSGARCVEVNCSLAGIDPEPAASRGQENGPARQNAVSSVGMQCLSTAEAGQSAMQTTPALLRT